MKTYPFHYLGPIDKLLTVREVYTAIGEVLGSRGNRRKVHPVDKDEGVCLYISEGLRNKMEYEVRFNPGEQVGRPLDEICLSTFLVCGQPINAKVAREVEELLRNRRPSKV